MAAYVDAAKRLFLAVVSSTATRFAPSCRCFSGPVCAGEFMGMLPVTLIFVLSASLLVALIYTPVLAACRAACRAGSNGRPLS